MREMFFEDNIDDLKYCGHLYGLGTAFVNGVANLTMSTSTPESATGNAVTSSNSSDHSNNLTNNALSCSSSSSVTTSASVTVTSISTTNSTATEVNSA